ncbi:uncharacterized protein LOC116012626 isoform X3 [Ipomoea triloba]|nr:uncharacterized protein LOC116012626 isoform X3 [Ipomoea triloba]
MAWNKCCGSPFNCINKRVCGKLRRSSMHLYSCSNPRRPLLIVAASGVTDTCIVLSLESKLKLVLARISSRLGYILADWKAWRLGTNAVYLPSTALIKDLLALCQPNILHEGGVEILSYVHVWLVRIGGFASTRLWRCCG